MSDVETAGSTRWATYLRAARRSKGLSQDDLAMDADVSRQTIIRWEGAGAVFDREAIARLRRVCHVLDIPLSAAFAAIALDEGEDAEQLPPPLPRQLARLLDCFNDMTPADRDLLLERVDWVSEWGDARIARYGEEPTRRRRRATG